MECRKIIVRCNGLLDEDVYEYLTKKGIKYEDKSNRIDLNDQLSILTKYGKLNISDSSITDKKIQKLNCRKLNISRCQNITGDFWGMMLVKSINISGCKNILMENILKSRRNIVYTISDNDVILEYLFRKNNVRFFKK